MTSPFEGIFGGLHEGGIKADGSQRVTAGVMGPMVAELDMVAGLVGEIPTTMFVTSTKWARIAKEVEVMVKRPNPENFRSLILRNLTVVNACSEDQEAVNILNVPEARKCDFQNRRARLVSGRK